MQNLSSVPGLPFQASSGLAVSPSLSSCALNDAILIKHVEPSWAPGGSQQLQLTGIRPQLPVGQVFTAPLQTLQTAVMGPPQMLMGGSSAPLMQPRSSVQLPREHRTIFFAGCTPIVNSETIYALFSQFGLVEDVNLFRPYSGSKTSKGCGLVVFADRAAATVALESLHGKFQWPGARSPMVLEWLDPTKQHKKARAQPLSLHSLHPLHQHHVGCMMQPGLARMMPNQMSSQLVYGNTLQLFC